jgi:hypothetical protein
MNQSTVELQIPPEVYERARQIAKASNRSVESKGGYIPRSLLRC